jgi:transcriptional repressor NrdR
VLKRSGSREPFDRSKVVRGIEAAVKNRRVDETLVHELVSEIEDSLRNNGDECTSSDIGVAVLDALHRLDEVAYLRFASVYKGFEKWSDFEEEASLLAGRSLDKSMEFEDQDGRE